MKKSQIQKDTKNFCQLCEIEKQISGLLRSLVIGLVLQLKCLNFVQLLSKSLKVALKNAKQTYHCIDGS